MGTDWPRERADRDPDDDGLEEPAGYSTPDDDDSFFPSYVPFGRPMLWTGQDRDDDYGRESEGYETDADDTWVDEGVIGLILLVGVALFLFPEPATSGVGILLILVGAVLWVVDWAG